MNKKGTTEYSGINRQSTRHGDDKMHNNLVHDNEYTFADEYYQELQTGYYEELMQDLKDENQE